MEKKWKQSKGLVIIYVGDGKGKTTAAMGAAVRALGHGWRVYVAQFMKEEKWPSGERDFFRSALADRSSEALAKEGRAFTTARGPATLHPHPTASVRDLLGLDGGPPPRVTPRDDLTAADRGDESPTVQPRETGEIHVEVMGEGFVGIMGDKKERDTHKEAAQRGYEKVVAEIGSGKYQLVVLDEILSAVDEGLLTEQQILDLMAKKPEDATLIMTGHKSYPAIFAKADLVTEMKKLKHPFDDGFIAKRGIDY